MLTKEHALHIPFYYTDVVFRNGRCRIQQKLIQFLAPRKERLGYESPLGTYYSEVSEGALQPVQGSDLVPRLFPSHRDIWLPHLDLHVSGLSFFF